MAIVRQQQNNLSLDLCQWRRKSRIFMPPLTEKGLLKDVQATMQYVDDMLTGAVNNPVIFIPFRVPSKRALSWIPMKYLDPPLLGPIPCLVERMPEVRHPRYVPPEEDFWKIYAVAEGQDKVMLLTFLHLASRL